MGSNPFWSNIWIFKFQILELLLHFLPKWMSKKNLREFIGTMRVPKGDPYCQCILSIFSVDMHQFYANILALYQCFIYTAPSHLHGCLCRGGLGVLNTVTYFLLPYCVPLTLCQFSEETLHPLPEFQIHDSHKFKMFFVKKKEKKYVKKNSNDDWKAPLSMQWFYAYPS